MVDLLDPRVRELTGTIFSQQLPPPPTCTWTRSGFLQPVQTRKPRNLAPIQHRSRDHGILQGNRTHTRDPKAKEPRKSRLTLPRARSDDDIEGGRRHCIGASSMLFLSRSLGSLVRPCPPPFSFSGPGTPRSSPVLVPWPQDPARRTGENGGKKGGGPGPRTGERGRTGGRKGADQVPGPENGGERGRPGPRTGERGRTGGNNWRCGAWHPNLPWRTYWGDTCRGFQAPSSSFCRHRRRNEEDEPNAPSFFFASWAYWWGILHGFWPCHPPPRSGVAGAAPMYRSSWSFLIAEAVVPWDPCSRSEVEEPRSSWPPWARTDDEPPVSLLLGLLQLFLQASPA